jgi:hypothetical protein
MGVTVRKQFMIPPGVVHKNQLRQAARRAAAAQYDALYTTYAIEMQAYKASIRSYQLRNNRREGVAQGQPPKRGGRI